MRFASHKDSILQNTVKVPVGVDGAFGVRDRGVENLTIARQAYAAALAQVELILEALAPFAANAQLSRFNVSCAIDDAFHIYLREMVRLVALLFFVFVCVPPPRISGLIWPCFVQEALVRLTPTANCLAVMRRVRSGK